MWGRKRRVVDCCAPKQECNTCGHRTAATRDHRNESPWARLGVWSQDWAQPKARASFLPGATWGLPLAVLLFPLTTEACHRQPFFPVPLPLNAAVGVALGLVLLSLVVPLDPRNKPVSPERLGVVRRSYFGIRTTERTSTATSQLDDYGPDYETDKYNRTCTAHGGCGTVQWECKHVLFRGQVSGLTADGKTGKGDFRWKAWTEKVTPQKSSSCTRRQGNEGLEAGPPVKEQLSSPESNGSCAWPQMEVPYALRGWERQGAQRHGRGEDCALCRVTARDVQAGGQPRFPWFPIHGIRTSWGVSVLFKGQREKGHLPALPPGEHRWSPPKSKGSAGQFLRDLKKGQVGYRPPSPMYTLYGVSTLPPLGTRLICLAGRGWAGRGVGGKRSAGGKRGRQDKIGLL